MTTTPAGQPAWHLAGRQKALALLRLGPAQEAVADRYELIELTSREDGAQLVALIWSLLGLVDQVALAAFGAEQWTAWLDREIAEAALRQGRDC